jgi:hypothetical protein
MNPEYFVNADINLVKSYDAIVVEKAFAYIANDAAIEFRYPQGGCQQRAHIMSLILTYKFNIEHCKLWLFSPAALTLNDCRPLFIQDPNDFTDHDTIEWNYHVVPLVNTNIENGIQQMIIDPSLNTKKLLNLSEFFELTGNANISKYTFLLPDKYFFNTSIVNNEPTNVFDGSFFNFDEFIKDDLTIEKGLASNDMVMQIFHKHVQPLSVKNDANENQKLTDLKAIFGNATAVDLLFSQNISGKSPNTTHRYVMTHYPEIVKEARNIFYERLNYWLEFTNSLMQ